MPIEDHLRPGERVLASSDSIYATSRRLIRFELRGLRETLESLRFDGISAIATRRRLRLQTTILAILVILLTIAIGPEGGVRWILVVIGLPGDCLLRPQSCYYAGVLRKPPSQPPAV